MSLIQVHCVIYWLNAEVTTHPRFCDIVPVFGGLSCDCDWFTLCTSWCESAAGGDSLMKRFCCQFCCLWHVWKQCAAATISITTTVTMTTSATVYSTASANTTATFCTTNADVIQNWRVCVCVRAESGSLKVDLRPPQVALSWWQGCLLMTSLGGRGHAEDSSWL